MRIAHERSEINGRILFEKVFSGAPIERPFGVMVLAFRVPESRQTGS